MVKLHCKMLFSMPSCLCHKINLYQGGVDYQKKEEVPLYCGTMSVAVTPYTSVMLFSSILPYWWVVPLVILSFYITSFVMARTGSPFLPL